MGQLVVLPDGQKTTIFELKDLLEVIDVYCGWDVRNLVRDGIRDLMQENEELEMENRDYQRTLECNEESHRDTLMNVRDDCDSLLDELAQPRLRRRKMQRIVRDLYKMVNEEL